MVVPAVPLALSRLRPVARESSVLERSLPHYLLVLGLQLGNQFALGSRVIRANGCGTVGQVGGLYLEKA